MLFAWCLALASLAPAQTGRPGPRSDVIIIVADDFAYDDLKEVPTPCLDLLAAQGMTFDRAYANPVCNVSRRSLTFGRFWIDTRGGTCGAPETGTPGAIFSLPKLARSLGYRTALFGKWHVGANPDGPYELAPQFHGYDTWRAGITTNVAESQCGRYGNYYEWRRLDDGIPTISHEYADYAVRDAALDWWISTRGPRFAVVSFQLCHEPFNPPPPELLPPGTPPPTTYRERYEQMVQALDTLVGQVLEAAGPEDIVIFVGDNGTPPIAAPDRFRAKGSTFERGIRVPLIVRAPMVRPGQMSSSLVHVADIMPTLAEIGGLKLNSKLGVSFLPVLLRPERKTREFVLCGWDIERRHGFFAPDNDRCLRSERYKLRVLWDGTESFYDLLTDPGENNPLELDDPHLKKELDRHRAALAHLDSLL